MKLPISIVIAVADDKKIINCLRSIDVFCEVVIVANGATREVMDILYDFSKKMNLKVIEQEERNLSKARDIGIIAASNNNILLMDTDCVFVPGTIRRFNDLLEINENKIINGSIEFESNTFGSRLVKNARDYINNHSNTGYAFAPSLGMKKDLIDLIGGYYFDHSIKWVEDAELNVRLRKYKIPIYNVPEARIIHSSISVKKDLRAAFNYGVGKRVGVNKGIMKGVGAFWGHTLPIIRDKGLLTALFMVVWNISYTIGYYSQPLNKSGRK